MKKDKQFDKAEKLLASLDMEELFKNLPEWNQQDQEKADRLFNELNAEIKFREERNEKE